MRTRLVSLLVVWGLLWIAAWGTGRAGAASSEVVGAGSATADLYVAASDPATVRGLGAVRLFGNNSLTTQMLYGQISGEIVSPTQQTGAVAVQVLANGTLTTVTTFAADGMWVGAYRFPLTDGAANQVLRSNGQGALAWSDITYSNITSLPTTTTMATPFAHRAHVADYATAANSASNVSSAGSVDAGAIKSGSLNLPDGATVNTSRGDKDLAVHGQHKDNLLFVDASADRMGVGTSTPSYVMHVVREGDDGYIRLDDYRDSAYACGLQISHAKGTLASPTVLSSGDQLGQIIFQGWDGSGGFARSASVLACVDAAPGSGDMPGRLEFQTSADGSVTPTTRVTIKNDGAVVMQKGLQMTGLAFDLSGISGSAQMYALGSGTATEMRVVDGNNGHTTISPHRFDLFAPDPAEPLPWSYYSENPLVGKCVNADITGALRALEALTGRQFVYTADLPPEKCVDMAAWQASETDRLILAAKQSALDADPWVEIAPADAFEDVPEAIAVASQYQAVRYRLDAATKSVVEYTVTVTTTTLRLTGATVSRVRADARIDETTGKVYRRRTLGEIAVDVDAIAAQVVPADYVNAQVPAAGARSNALAAQAARRAAGAGD